MSEHELLLRHAESWAESRKRPWVRDVVEQALDLRFRHDETPANSWPKGSAERLLLVTWPAYGPPRAPDPEVLRDSLDTYWRFLRSTGRMASGSAEPAELAKEARRAASKFAAACADPANHSQGRVLADFGRTIGVDLDDASDMEELQARLDTIQSRWNALPVDERRRLMPDPSPKSFAGQRFTAMANDLDEPFPYRGDVARAGDQAEHSAYVHACLALAEWVGDRREVTKIGVLRPAVAREAYLALGLWSWDRAWNRLVYRGLRVESSREVNPDVDRLMADGALHSWKSAGECLALDRLWYACDASGLVTIGSKTAARSARPLPDDPEGWLLLGSSLVLGLCYRQGHYQIEPLIGALLMTMQEEDGRVPMAEIQRWWQGRYAGRRASTGGSDELFHQLWRDRLDRALAMFDDTGLWTQSGEDLVITDFGREFAVVLINALDEGFFESAAEPRQ